jgi:hypothetical protein
MNDKIKSALSVNNDTHSEETVEHDEVAEENETASKVVTTLEEMEAFYAIKSMLVGVLDAADITHKDKETYFTICFKGMVTKWICRLYMNGNKKSVVIPISGKEYQRYAITSINDLYQYKQELIESAERYALATV